MGGSPSYRRGRGGHKLTCRNSRRQASPFRPSRAISAGSRHLHPGFCMRISYYVQPLLPGLLLAALACSSGRTAPGGATPSTEQTLTELFNLPALYQRMGRLAASGPMPFVGTVAFVAGQGDSTIARVGLS